MSGLHIVANRRRDPPRWYVYAWRGGPCIHAADQPHAPLITPQILDAAAEARRERTSAPAGTLEWLAGQFRASPEFTTLAANTRDAYNVHLDRICAEFGRVALATFEDRRMRAAVMEWRDGFAAQPSVADKAVAVLALLLAWAVQRGMLAINVAAGIPHLYKANRSDQIWTAEDWAALTPHASAHLLQALRLASLTGLRLGDLVALQWEHVGQKAIAVVTAKRKRRALIPILPDLARLLDELEPDAKKRKGAVLRNSRGAAWTASGLQTMFQRAKKLAKVDRHIHDLRGTYVTWLAQHRLTNEEIARIVGWSAKHVDELRLRYVDEMRVVESLTERLAHG